MWSSDCVLLIWYVVFVHLCGFAPSRPSSSLCSKCQKQWVGGVGVGGNGGHCKKQELHQCDMFRERGKELAIRLFAPCQSLQSLARGGHLFMGIVLLEGFQGASPSKQHVDQKKCGRRDATKNMHKAPSHYTMLARVRPKLPQYETITHYTKRQHIELFKTFLNEPYLRVSFFLLFEFLTLFPFPSNPYNLARVSQ